MSVPQPKTKVTAEEYLAFDREAEQRHEYVDGAIVAMPGGTCVHSVIAANIIAELGNALRARPWFVFTVNVRVKAGDDYFYPDASVACARRESLHEDILVDPVLIVEVLSDASEGLDRGKKFASYQRIPSLAHYLLVSQHQVRVEHYQRITSSGADNQWLLQILGAGQTLVLDTLECPLAVDKFYQKAFEA